ncbi:MAG: phosphocarrier protein HPr [Verrucomicrobiales bacterium]|nr:phosphocarrier protein HPr [Verrucomicrobiales bacterium]
MTEVNSSNGETIIRELVIQNQFGLHARPAAAFVKTANQFSADIMVSKPGEDAVNGKSIMGLMTLAAGNGTKLVLETSGPDAEKAATAIEELVQGKFDEA